jgi:hypothetical protein
MVNDGGAFAYFFRIYGVDLTVVNITISLELLKGIPEKGSLGLTIRLRKCFSGPAILI